MIKIGLTGGIGSGKSSVARWFADRGVRVFDADQTVHRLFTNLEVIEALKLEFGEAVAHESGINRKWLGSIVFANHDAKFKLEKIIHPLVLGEMRNACAQAEAHNEKMILLDIPLLYETGWQDYADEVWVVYVPRNIQIDRIVARNQITVEEAEQRIAAQMPIDEKAKKADRIINNSGSWAETEKLLAEIWADI